MNPSDTADLAGFDLPLEELVFSCNICQATPSEVYAEKQRNPGFSNDHGNVHDVVTRLWIAECSHVFCGKHLAGGAVPFQPENSSSRAPCPYCQSERHDDEIRDLYGIRGLHEGEYDPIIPSEWMHCPAVKLDGSTPAMEAIRFQYNALALYARRARRYWKVEQQKQSSLQSNLATERKRRERLETEMHEQEKRFTDLEKSESKLQKWEARKPMINHYLGVVTDMAEDIEVMTNKLSELGFQVAGRSYAFVEAQQEAPKVEDRQYKAQVDEIDDNVDEHSSSSRKRKLDEYSDGAIERQPGLVPSARRSSRDLMPPPMPTSKVPSQGMIPKIRKKTCGPFGHSPGRRGKIQIYEDQSGQATSTYLPVTDHRQRSNIEQSAASHHPLPLRPSLPSALLSQPVPDGCQHTSPQFTHAGSTEVAASPSHAGPRLDAQRGRGHLVPFESHNGSESRTHIHQGREPPHVAHRDASHERRTEMVDADARRPLQPFSVSWLNQQRGPGTRAWDQRSTPPNALTESPATSVVSPFFRSDSGVPRLGIRQRPPARPGHHLDATSAAGDQQARIVREAPFYHNPSLAAASQVVEVPSLYRPQYDDLETARSVRHQYLTPQTPRNANVLLECPDGNAQGLTAFTQPRPTTYRGRISLPVEQQQSSLTSNRPERRLFQIPGFRGLSSRAPQGNTPTYDTPRELFSSAGSRRSVRR